MVESFVLPSFMLFFCLELFCVCYTGVIEYHVSVGSRFSLTNQTCFLCLKHYRFQAKCTPKFHITSLSHAVNGDHG